MSVNSFSTDGKVADMENEPPPLRLGASISRRLPEPPPGLDE